MREAALRGGVGCSGVASTQLTNRAWRASPALVGGAPYPSLLPGPVDDEGRVEERSEFCGWPTPRRRATVARRLDGRGTSGEVPVRQHGAAHRVDAK